MTDFLLTLPAPLRHLVLLALAGLLAWAGTDVVPWLENQPGRGVLAAGLLTAILGVITPLVTSYGVGAARARELGARPPK